MPAPLGVLVSGSLLRRLWSTSGGKLLIGGLILALISSCTIAPGLMIAITLPILTSASEQNACRPGRAPDQASDPGMAAEQIAPPPDNVVNEAPAELDAGQVGVAWTIWQVTNSVAGDLGIAGDAAAIEQAATIGMITAAQESTWGANKTAVNYPNSDNDMGVFQQRVLLGWYYNGTTQADNEAQAKNVAQQARIFFLGNTVSREAYNAARAAGVEPAGGPDYIVPGLKQVEHWRDMAPTEAAQAVQRSAFPQAYAKHEGLARSLIAVFRTVNGDAAPTTDQVGATAANTGPANCGPLDQNTAMKCPDLPPAQAAMIPGVEPDVQLVARCVMQKFPKIVQLYGIGERANVSDHPEGKALDVMLGDGAFADYYSPDARAYGKQIADFVVKNAKALGVTYVVYDEQIWNIERERDGWRRCGTPEATCYAGPDDNQAHRNHVHISTLGDGASKEQTTAGSGGVNPQGARAPLDSWRNGPAWRATGSWSRWHTGTDLAGNPNGTPVYAVADGVVVEGTPSTANWAGSAYVAINHGGPSTLYAHLDERTVRPGDQVKAGDVIGVTGERGRSFGPHLHFEYYPPGVKPGQVYDTGDPVAWMKTLGVDLTQGNQD